jgi:hypothetical protein
MRRSSIALLLAAGSVAPGISGASAPREAVPAAIAQPAPSAERTVWYFYRVKWGFQDEFVALFKKNHYPVLKAQIGERLVSVKTYAPTYHGDGRADWTFAVAITYRDTAAMTGPSPEAELSKKLFPDQATFRREEQRRFEILDAHWDVPLNEVSMTQ